MRPASPVKETIDDASPMARACHAHLPSLPLARFVVLLDAKFDNLYVERQQSALAAGSPEEFRANDEAEVYDKVRSKYGLDGEKRFRQFVEDMRQMDTGKLLEYEAADADDEWHLSWPCRSEMASADICPSGWKRPLQNFQTGDRGTGFHWRSMDAAAAG